MKLQLKAQALFVSMPGLLNWTFIHESNKEKFMEVFDNFAQKSANM